MDFINSLFGMGTTSVVLLAVIGLLNLLAAWLGRMLRKSMGERK